MMRKCLRFAPMALALLLAPWPAAMAAEEGYAGSEDCAACHEEIAQEFGRTSHARAPGWSETRKCESCHGPAMAHIEGQGDISKIRRPGQMSPSESSAVCLDCHARNKTNFAHKSNLHSLADVACVDCHNPHSHGEKMLVAQGAALCAKCHQDKVSQFELPRSHPLAPKGEACVSCHDPHAASSPRHREGFFTDKCAECHFEKGGPFLFAHDISLVEGCQACHQVHGSSGRHLLKTQRQVDLCYQCHPGTITPGFHSAPTFVNEKCGACHTAIHGSNTNEFFLEE